LNQHMIYLNHVCAHLHVRISQKNLALETILPGIVLQEIPLQKILLQETMVAGPMVDVRQATIAVPPENNAPLEPIQTAIQTTVQLTMDLTLGLTTMDLALESPAAVNHEKNCRIC